ncbi:MAG: zinc ribbon domain-containing protein [Bacteroidales bacterium]|nr:zinc ribbon domain-containing protein [Bacteroidales bacterium]MDD3666799.1 zinc ribbon domain-containing protein [Bacteroidales bacterium]
MEPSIFIAIGVFLLLFLLLREVNAWYWKINERVKLMERQAVSLQRIENKLEELVESFSPVKAPLKDNHREENLCPACNNPVSENDQFCPSCGLKLFESTNT